MILRVFKAVALVLITVILVNNIYLAAKYYNISHVHLSDNFYWQSVNDVLVDNKVEKVQVVGEAIDFETVRKVQKSMEKQTVIYQVKRDSYRQKWQ